MTFHNFYLFYKIVILLIYSFLIGVTLSFGIDFYYFIVNHINDIKNLKTTELQYFSDTVFWPALWQIIHLFIKVIISFCLLHLFKRIPIPNKILAFWDSRNEFNHATGREIVYYLRFQRYLNFFELIHIKEHIDKQLYLLNIHNTKEIKNMFEKYDPHFIKDMEK